MIKPYHFIFILFSLNVAYGQVIPAENSSLNYRIIGFYVPDQYLNYDAAIEIAKDNHNNEQTFQPNIILTYPCSQSKNTIEVPLFGTSYTWRIKLKKNASLPVNKEFHHFETKVSAQIDTHNHRMRITQPTRTYKNAYVFIDRLRTLYDMKGNPVWFLPAQTGNIADNTVTRDIKITPQGTITYMYNDKIFEADWNGNTLWAGPNNDKSPNDTFDKYHHEFTRLSNGHYMVLGNEYVSVERDTTVSVAKPNPAPHPPMGATALGLQSRRMGLSADGKTFGCLFGTVIEYDETGNVVWRWRSVTHFNSELKKRGKKVKSPVDTHENSFYFDEKNGYVYVSFKNSSQILKIMYPSGKVVETYGKKFSLDPIDTVKSLFCDQHSVRVSPKGYMYLYNNNMCNLTETPQAIRLTEPSKKGATLQKIWQFNCPVDFTDEKKGVRSPITSGGNVLELTDESLFISTSMPFPNLYIVDKNNNVTWGAITENYNKAKRAWVGIGQYRGSIILERQQLEDLIWNTIDKNTNTTLH